ncbi:MAG: hypothetical protein ACXWMS_09190 [Syntrophales bacterium]
MEKSKSSEKFMYLSKRLTAYAIALPHFMVKLSRGTQKIALKSYEVPPLSRSYVLWGIDTIIQQEEFVIL